MPSLKLGLLHLAVDHKQPDNNRQRLLALCREAERGMQMIVAPELALSGYGFAGIRDMLPYAETVGGPTLTALAEICREHGMFACIGMAERDEPSGILYNSAFVLDPAGDIVCRYRKINAEFRWACPGDPTEDNTFDTPWGRVGVLICSDCYHSLMPRVTALRGANLLLIPANWPPVGGLIPLEIWRARAMENGLFVAVCNRTGLDETMDCRKAASALISARGAVHLHKTARTSKMMRASIPLNSEDRFKSGQRLKRLTGRPGGQLHACYLNRAGINDLTSLLQLPRTGQLRLCCHCPDAGTGLQPVLSTIEADRQTADTLHVLPTGPYTDIDIDALHLRCGAGGQKAVLTRIMESGEVLYWFDGKEEPLALHWNSGQGRPGEPLPVFDCGTARVHLVPESGLHHPEMILACAKEGADLVIIFNRLFNEEIRLLAGARTIEQAAVVVCSPLGGGIWTTPEGHQRWGETLACPGEYCTAVLDTHKTRVKRFQERIDYRTLLQDPLKGLR